MYTFTKKLKNLCPILLTIIGPVSAVQGQERLTYQKPPQEILDLLNAPPVTQVSFNGKGTMMLLLERPDYPGIEQVAQPILRIGGLRINPANNAAANNISYNNIKIKDLKQGTIVQVTGLPRAPRISNITWSPDESTLAFVQENATSAELWIVDLSSRAARRLTDIALNDAYGTTFRWAADSKSILGQFVPAGRGQSPRENIVPEGPVVQENLGKTAASRTYQDLLKNPYDESLFDFYLTAQLKEVDLNGKTKDIGRPAIYSQFDYSPDGNYIMTKQIEKPYSYLVPAYLFPYKIQILKKDGELVKDLYSAPLADNRPKGFDAVDKGPREHAWRPNEPSTIYWAEAQDEGDPNKAADLRDKLYTLKAPFNTSPVKIADCTYRFSDAEWAGDGLAVITERWWKTRQERRSLINTKDGRPVKVISERSYEQTYTDPGDFVLSKNSFGRPVLLLDQQATEPVAFTISTGASPLGDRPFLLRWNLSTGKTDTLFRSKTPYYELPVFFNNQGQVIISRESKDQTPNYYSVNLKNRTAKALTSFPDPYPSLKGVQKQQLAYKRRDGINMSGTLYLPKGYKKGDAPLPLLMWAYPREFKSVDAASQVKGSPYRYTRISWGSPVYWVARGYAVLDNADMPIVGEGSNEPNDSFIQQLQDNAKAAIDYVVNMGVADRKKIAVGGHSYGAFMTANLLAHTDYFAAGIARSGAYNRTLTPFGFQQEERTYWQAPEVYYKMSPFSYADKIKTPLLLIHGAADDNSGTFPIQSERLYNALKGHGATTRLVFLPNEAHHYYAKESVMHMLWEMDKWLDTYVKNKK